MVLGIGDGAGGNGGATSASPTVTSGFMQQLAGHKRGRRDDRAAGGGGGRAGDGRVKVRLTDFRGGSFDYVGVPHFTGTGAPPRVGDLLHAMDQGGWYESAVVGQRNIESAPKRRQVNVHFTGWGHEFDQWVDDDSPRLQPLWAQRATYAMREPKPGAKGAKGAKAKAKPKAKPPVPKFK